MVESSPTVQINHTTNPHPKATLINHHQQLPPQQRCNLTTAPLRKKKPDEKLPLSLCPNIDRCHTTENTKENKHLSAGPSRGYDGLTPPSSEPASLAVRTDTAKLRPKELLSSERKAPQAIPPNPSAASKAVLCGRIAALMTALYPSPGVGRLGLITSFTDLIPCRAGAFLRIMSH